MKKAEGTINIEAYLECPHCHTYVDLFQIKELNDDTQLSRLISEDDKEALDDYQEVIDCPDCFKKIQIEGLSY